MPLCLSPDEEPVPGYTLVRRLGRGGFGEVWQAIAPGGIPVALKFIEFDGGAAQVEERALRIVCRLRHPYLLEMHWAKRIGDHLVIATSLCNGNLSDHLKSCKKQGYTGVPVDELLKYLCQAAEALDYLNTPHHEDERRCLVGIQHRDVKPANLFLLGGVVKVADFGLAKILDDSSSRHSGSMTPHYAPPEMFHGAVTDRSDQYSLAVSYVELRTGRLPFTADSITQLMYKIVHEVPDLEVLPEAERPIVARSLAKSPTDRWESCSAFAEALRLLQPTSFRQGATTLASHAQMPPVRPLTRTEAADDDAATIAMDSRTQPEDPTTAGSEMGSRSWANMASAALAVGLAIGLVWLKNRPSEPKPEPQPVAPAEPLTAPFTPAQAVSAQVRWAQQLGWLVPSFTNTIGMDFRLVPPGEFEMGSRQTVEELEEIFDNDSVGFEMRVRTERPPHRVRISKPFFVGSHEVTVGQFRAFVEETGYKTEAETDGRGGEGLDQEQNQILSDSPRFNWRSTGLELSDSHPAVNVTWNDATAFCHWLSQKENKTYRLLTEAEWEYACQAGAQTMYSNGDDPEQLVEVGNIADHSAEEEFDGSPRTIHRQGPPSKARPKAVSKTRKRPPLKGSPRSQLNDPHSGPELNFLDANDGYAVLAPVGRFKPNAFGLYDMHGNVWEWCSDWFDPAYYQTSPSVDPQGPPSGELRSLRGGSWLNAGPANRSAGRFALAPDARRLIFGFRVALEVQDRRE